MMSSRAERQGVVRADSSVADQQSGTTGLVVCVGICVWAATLCQGISVRHGCVGRRQNGRTEVAVVLNSGRRACR